MSSKVEWPLFEVFIRSRRGLSHVHAGSLHAADARMAIENARDVYTRRGEGTSIWVVPAVEITASAPESIARAAMHSPFFGAPRKATGAGWVPSMFGWGPGSGRSDPVG